MLCVLGISLMIWGIVSISTGKMTLTAHKVVGPPAVYFLSIMMILALPINFLLGLIIGVQIGMAGGQQLDQATQVKLTIMEACITGGTFLIVLVLGFILGVDPNELKRSRRGRDDDFDDEDDDDRPRRRRPRDDDEDDDEPRRKRRRDEEEEEDRPRRRPASKDSDDEGIAPGPPR